MSDIVQKLWGFCHVLRHDGIDYGDYIEQLTYLLFLKMADERGVEMPKGCDWRTLYKQTGTDLTDHYVDVLRTLAKQSGLLGDIFAGAQSRFNNPVNLKRMITLIDETEWTALDVDVKAEAFEGLLEKAASEGKKGAGQYFTPRVLIKSIVRCMKPDPRLHKEFTIGDPACGTGGFLVSAYEWLIQQTGGALERDIAKRVRRSTFYGQDLVERPRRLALMNLYLHGLEPEIALGDAIYEVPTGRRFDVVLTNPPFGTKGANQAPEREDFTIETSNKQLNFLQHVLAILKPGGRAAVVLPDNCLFESKAGEVIEILMQDCNLHTVLRLPRGTFTPYSQGVKANVIFFQKGYPTEAIWIFDARSNVPGITKKDRPLTPQHFVEFEAAYGNDPNGKSRRKDSGETPRVSFDQIASHRIPLPPLNEQRRIVAKLEKLLSRVGTAEARLAAIPSILKRFRQSVLAAACSGRLTGDWRDGNRDDERCAKDAELRPTSIADSRDYPNKWRLARLGELTTLVTSGSRGWAKYYSHVGSIFIRAQNINSDILNLEDIAFIKLPGRTEGARTKVQQHDILITITGANVTKSALVESPIADAYVSQHVALVRLADFRLSKFLCTATIIFPHRDN
jgi:type I restriction enzyme M protein